MEKKTYKVVRLTDKVIIRGDEKSLAIPWEWVRPRRIGKKYALKAGDTLYCRSGYYYKKKDLTPILLALIMALILVTVIMVALPENEPDFNSTGQAPSQSQDLYDNSDGKFRLSMNTNVLVADGMLENLNFANYNKDRYLRVRIETADQCIYDSQMVAEGQIIGSDYLTADADLKTGDHDATAVVYTYDEDKQERGKTNVKINLAVQ